MALDIKNGFVFWKRNPYFWKTSEKGGPIIKREFFCLNQNFQNYRITCVTLTKHEFERIFRICPLRGHERFMFIIKITKLTALCSRQCIGLHCSGRV
jgi:hypothetical protein